MSKFTDGDVPYEYRPLGAWKYFWLEVLFGIPFIGLIFTIVFACGASGNNLTWSFNRCTGVLTISGTGAMADWGAEADVPWYKYRESITPIVLPVDLTHIGANAFYGCAMTKIDIPAAVRTFGTRAFFSSSLQEICIPEGVTTLLHSSFLPKQ